jgi:hypothetical protein
MTEKIMVILKAAKQLKKMKVTWGGGGVMEDKK